MSATKNRNIIVVSVGLALLTFLLLVGGFGVLTFPVSWPGLIILGADETQERYGYWGELVLFWLCSLPCIVAYAWLLCRWGQRRVSAR